MHLNSATFAPNHTVPRSMVATDCGGENRSPVLTWSDAPKGTKSFALLVHDPDAPRAGGFDHWVLYNLPPAKPRLAPNEPSDGTQGRNGTGAPGYYGPCPPPGNVHHYVFTLFALDVAHIGGDAPLDAAAMRRAITGHVLAEATLTGLYQR